MALASPVYAATVKTSGYTTINPTDAQFESAASPKYFNKSEKISGAISSSYDMNITHYEAPASGFYSIYTTGSTDTVGKVFEQQNVLWVTTDYLERDYDDDDGDALNYKMVVDLDIWEDYYICTRAYSSKTGSYNLVIEPNLDRITSSNGGKWINDHVSWLNVSQGSIATLSKDYYTAEQVKTYYQMLRNEDTRQSIAEAFSATGVKGAVSKIGELLKIVISIVDFGTTGNAVVSGVAFVEGVFTSMMEELKSTKSANTIMLQLATAGGAGYSPEAGIDVYYASYGVCVTSKAQGINTDYYSYIIYTDSYARYTSKSLVGVQYEAGHWE